MHIIDAGHRALELAPDNTAVRVLQESLDADAGNYSAAQDPLKMLVNEPLETRQVFRAQKEVARVVYRLGSRNRCSSIYTRLLHFLNHSRNMPNTICLPFPRSSRATALVSTESSWVDVPGRQNNKLCAGQWCGCRQWL
jgi:hypothetical protein